MEKVFKILANSMLTVFLFGIMILPIISMGVMGFKNQTVEQGTEVLSVQDTKKVEDTEAIEDIENAEETTESSHNALINPE